MVGRACVQIPKPVLLNESIQNLDSTKEEEEEETDEFRTFIPSVNARVRVRDTYTLSL